MRRQQILQLTICILMGLAIGIGSFTFIYARGQSYFTNNAAACANCHIMQDHYDSWVKSSHHAVASCNDCHAPDTFLAKYWTKASNGFWHSYAFTTGDFHEPIEIKPRNRKVTEQACHRCHTALVEAIDGHGDSTTSCIRCHHAVGHLN